ncbi:hypothetical protein [Geothrix terrae]|uniref:hypothetical protein n=1 Tax=Geothrix terrae TaxID=2922720 RepID=UPI001FACBA05|nr:hypothetical protein [Geothrix terrae]
MKTAAQIASLADQLKQVSDRLVNQEFVQNEAITKVKENTRLSDVGKKEALAKVSGLEVLTTLNAQVQILKADLDAAQKDWDNLGQVLRAAALPMGVTPESAATFSLLRDEASALESDPNAFQIALEDAALTKDWARLYAMVLGRMDENGMPLDSWRGVIRGIRLDCCDLPGQLTVMDALYRGKAAYLAATAAWQHATAQSNTTTVCIASNLASNYAKAKYDREARTLLTPSEALQRAEDERSNPKDRYERLPDEGGLFAIFDRANGVTRFVDQKTGPAYLAKLNALTHIPTPADGLPQAAPVTADDGVVPGGN